METNFMTSTIREYTMNGTTIMGIDHGYGNIKTARTIFPSSAIKSNSEPTYYRMPFYIPLPISNIFKINKEQTSMLWLNSNQII